MIDGGDELTIGMCLIRRHFQFLVSTKTWGSSTQGDAAVTVAW